jgi:hypothetical protein
MVGGMGVFGVRIGANPTCFDLEVKGYPVLEWKVGLGGFEGVLGKVNKGKAKKPRVKRGFLFLGGVEPVGLVGLSLQRPGFKRL